MAAPLIIPAVLIFLAGGTVATGTGVSIYLTDAATVVGVIDAVNTASPAVCAASDPALDKLQDKDPKSVWLKKLTAGVDVLCSGAPGAMNPISQAALVVRVVAAIKAANVANGGSNDSGSGKSVIGNAKPVR